MSLGYLSNVLDQMKNTGPDNLEHIEVIFNMLKLKEYPYV